MLPEDDDFNDDEDTKYCIEDGNCLDLIQWCDKTVFKEYGTCAYHWWLWLVIALAVLAAILSLSLCLLKLRRYIGYTRASTHQGDSGAQKRGQLRDIRTTQERPSEPYKGREVRGVINYQQTTRLTTTSDQL